MSGNLYTFPGAKGNLASGQGSFIGGGGFITSVSNTDQANSASGKFSVVVGGGVDTGVGGGCSD